jgi:Fur family transcriptional regulator, peroxide stress response regulator
MVTDSESAVEERTRKILRDLRASGHRVTPQRMAIVREFVGRCDHPSAEALYEELSSEFPMMAISTVYSTLKLLAEMGEAVEVAPSMSEMRFDPDVGDHCHLTCLRCSRIEDLPLEACSSAGDFAGAARSAGFRPLRQVYQVFGYCKRCQR